MRRCAPLVVLLAVLVGAVAAGEARGEVLLGIADQKAETFSDPRMHALGMRRARIAVSWDVLEIGWERERLDRWLAAAAAGGVEPLVSFQHSARDRRSLPSPVEFTEQFLAFRERYPQVTRFATWNEANHCGEPTCHRPELVASYWRKLSLTCRRCTVLAAEVLDLGNMSRWILDFRAHTRKRYRGAVREPRFWGLHNYVDANRFRTIGTRRMRAHTRGQIWLTEVGGIVSRNNRSDLDLPRGPRHAARATRFLLERLVPLTGRIRRVYLYHWQVDDLQGTWDSGLITPGGNERPAYRVLADWVSARRARDGAGG